MIVEIVIEAAQFPEKEYINGIFVAVLVLETVNLAYWWRHVGTAVSVCIR
jgi:hypothetical protein